MATSTTKAFHRGRQFGIKENGLPSGEGLFWLNAERKYIYGTIHGERFSCQTNDWRDAVDFMDLKRQEHAKREAGIGTGDILVNELLDDVITHYEDLARKRGSYGTQTPYIAKTQMNMKDGIRDTFGGLKVSKLVPTMYADYRRKWERRYMEKGKTADQVQNTIDHHLTILRRAIKLGTENRKVPSDVPVPKIDKENSRKNARSSVVTPEQFEQLLRALPDWLQPIFSTCYITGTRKKEATFIHRSSVDFAERLIRLRANETKQGKARTNAVPRSHWQIVENWEARTRLEHPTAEYLFHIDGEQVTTKQMDDAFNRTCETLGIHKPITNENGLQSVYRNREPKFDRSTCRWHDTRRTATTTVSNLYGVTDSDIHRTVGLSRETHLIYDKTESAKKVRDALDRLEPVATVNPSEPVRASTSGSDKRRRLLELKELYEDDLIDEDEYKAAKAEVLKEPLTRSQAALLRDNR